MRRNMGLQSQETDDVDAKRPPETADERDDQNKQSKENDGTLLCDYT